MSSRGRAMGYLRLAREQLVSADYHYRRGDIHGARDGRERGMQLMQSALGAAATPAVRKAVDELKRRYSLVLEDRAGRLAAANLL